MLNSPFYVVGVNFFGKHFDLPVRGLPFFSAHPLYFGNSFYGSPSKFSCFLISSSYVETEQHEEEVRGDGKMINPCLTQVLMLVGSDGLPLWLVKQYRG